MKEITYFTQRITKQLIKEDLGECWLWTGATNSTGYGVFCDRKEKSRNRMAHRDLYELTTKKKIERFACHRCDQTRCINPDHIYDGSPTENRADAVKRQRIAPRLLSDEKIAILLKGFRDGVEQKEIAKQIGVCKATVLRFLNGQLNQHTHNYVKEAEDTRNTKIKTLFAEGKSLSEIMVEASVPASVIWTVVPEIREREKGKESQKNLQIKATMGLEERNKQIREKRTAGKSVKELALEYGVSAQLIYKIVK